MGFLLKEGPGYSRDIPLNEPVLEVADDLTVHDLAGTLALTRTPQGLYVVGRLKANLPSECSLCLTPLQQAVTSRFSELYHFPPEDAPEDGQVIPEDMNLDFSAVVREDMLLSVPIRQLCRPDCKGLCPNCGKNWNEGPCDCQIDEGDPRLAVLKDLLKKKSD